ncbi:glycoside hydrolase family 47 protein [Hymenopellis radicata]|nr:glycoside hydrolase family 47 protein [Hymenopellis radicata]
MRLDITVVSLSTLFLLPTSAVTVQKPGLVLPESAAANKDAVKSIFLDSYEAYKTYAWGHDDLTPESKSFFDGRNGWGASIVDAMSTMYAMGLDDLLDEAVDFASKIDFSSSKTSDRVSVFETTIRFLGGLLSVYELRGEKDAALLERAQDVADKMAFAWVEDHDLPYGFLDFSTNTPTLILCMFSDSRQSNIAEAGTLILEWATLSKHTGNDTYRELAEKSFRHIAELPHRPNDWEFVGGYVSWGGGADSYFEYLLKYARLAELEDSFYIDTWRTAVDSSIKNLLRTSTVGDHVYTCTYNGTAEDPAKRFRHLSSHLACFHGGNWLFGGTLLGNETIVNHALDLIDGCWNTYASTATGIGPEAFAYSSTEGNFTGLDTPSADQLAFFEEHGFYITSEYYILRPEVLESNFYAWRITGDTKYLDRAASAVESFQKYLPANAGYDGIWDVNVENADRIDDMESFWFAEVLKYLYLTFDDPANMSLDEFVFNTEAHPFKAPPASDSYGSETLVYNGSLMPPPRQRCLLSVPSRN